MTETNAKTTRFEVGTSYTLHVGRSARFGATVVRRTPKTMTLELGESGRIWMRVDEVTLRVSEYEASDDHVVEEARGTSKGWRKGLQMFTCAQMTQ